jgi:hypothetical protein
MAADSSGAGPSTTLSTTYIGVSLGMNQNDLLYILVFTRVSSTNSLKDSEDSNIDAPIHIPSSISHANRRR